MSDDEIKSLLRGIGHEFSTLRGELQRTQEELAAQRIEGITLRTIDIKLDDLCISLDRTGDTLSEHVAKDERIWDEVRREIASSHVSQTGLHSRLQRLEEVAEATKRDVVELEDLTGRFEILGAERTAEEANRRAEIALREKNAAEERLRYAEERAAHWQGIARRGSKPPSDPPELKIRREETRALALKIIIPIAGAVALAISAAAGRCSAPAPTPPPTHVSPTHS